MLDSGIATAKLVVPWMTMNGKAMEMNGNVTTGRPRGDSIVEKASWHATVMKVAAVARTVDHNDGA